MARPALLALLLAAACTGDPVEAAKDKTIVHETRFMRLQLEMKQLAQELERHRIVHGDWPADLHALRRPITDPWGTEYAFQPHGERAWIVSAGPDGEFDTDDDVGGGSGQ